MVLDFCGKCQDFVHELNDVTLIDGFLQPWSGPGTHEAAFLVDLTAMVIAFGQQFGLFTFHAGSTEGKREFTSTAVG